MTVGLKEWFNISELIANFMADYEKTLQYIPASDRGHSPVVIPDTEPDIVCAGGKDVSTAARERYIRADARLHGHGQRDGLGGNQG